MGFFAPPNIRELKEKGDIKGLIKTLRHKHESIVREAREALVDTGEAAIGPLIEDLSNTAEDFVEFYSYGKVVAIRWPSAEPLARIGVPAVAPLIQTLKGYLGKDQPERDYGAIRRRAGAAVTLGLIGDKQAVQPLIESFEHDPYNLEYAAIALGVIGDRQAVEPLIKWLRQQDTLLLARSPAVYVVEALGKIGDRRAVQPLIEVVLSWFGNFGDSVNLHNSAIKALAEIGDETVIESVIKGLSDEDLLTRELAAEALGKLGDARAVQSLTKVLTDKIGSVRKAATDALVKIGVPAVPALMKALEDNSKHARKSAAEALKKIEGKK